MGEIIVEVRELCKKYGSYYALDHVDFSIKKGEIIGLVGPNGAGKTTTLKLLARLISPYSGEVLIAKKNGELQDIFENHKELVEMGFLIDIPHFFNTTPIRMLKYIGRVRKYPKESLKPRINMLLEKFDLGIWKKKKLKTFSKGMLQKVGFLCAVVHEPELIILDEPQTGLDPSARIKIREFLKELKKAGKTILISSHLLHELREICTKVILLNQGSVIGYDTINNLEKFFNIKELRCEVLDHILPTIIPDLEKKIEGIIGPYLAKESKIPKGDLVAYDPIENMFTIIYDGKESSSSKILKILMTEFQSDFTIRSFYEPKSTQMENLYSQMTRLEKREYDRN